SDIQGEKCYGSCPTFLISGHPVTPIASILALWIPQALGLPYASRRFQSILKRTRTFSCLSRASQATFRTSTGTWGRRPMVARMLFTYFPDLQWPQRDGSAMGQHDIVGFPNGSMMLHRVQPTDSGTYQVAVNINPAWIMRAKTEVQVAEKHKELPIIHLPVSAGIMAAIIIGSLSAGSLFICCIAHLLLTGGWRGQSHRYRGPASLSLCLLPHLFSVATERRPHLAPDTSSKSPGAASPQLNSNHMSYEDQPL
uniref:Immunoglobulin V-set domain-containing protein n=1 Tax=Canis lupus familiaris TaxID=9615 RepID=A0A8C0M3K2_CANLF